MDKTEGQRPPPERMEQLKDQELVTMRVYAERFNLKPDALEKEYHNLALTVAEHACLGSGSIGLAFHPNMPMARLGGVSLEAVNKGRSEINRQGKHFFLYESPTGQLFFCYIEFPDLTEEMIKMSAPCLSFKLKKIEPVKEVGGNSLAMPSETEVLAFLNKKLEQDQKDRRDKLWQGETLVM